MNYNIIKLAEDTIPAQSQKLIPTKEMNEILRCASNMIKVVEGFQECKIPINGCHIGIDALSQIVGLMSPPSQFKPKLMKHYASINMHLYKLAQMTSQVKETSISG